MTWRKLLFWTPIAWLVAQVLIRVAAIPAQREDGAIPVAFDRAAGLVTVAALAALVAALVWAAYRWAQRG